MNSSLVNGPLTYKTQWTGSQNIPVGQSYTFTFSTDAIYVNVLGAPKQWDMKVHRANGQKHTCQFVDMTDTRPLTKPDVCYEASGEG